MGFGTFLSIVELIFYPASLYPTVRSFGRIVKCQLMTQCLRVLLCIIFLRDIINAIRRSIILSERIFFIGEEASLYFEALNNTITYFSWYIICFSSIILCIERLLATYYRTKVAAVINSNYTLALMVFVMLASSLCLSVWCQDIAVLYVQIGTFGITSPILGFLYWKNRKWRTTKLHKSLVAKCEFEINMHGILTVLPLMTLVNLCSAGRIMLIHFQLNKIGNAVLISNNGFGLLIALECLLSPSVILLSFKYMDYKAKSLRKQCANRDIEEERAIYFSTLSIFWDGERRKSTSQSSIRTTETDETSL